MKKIINTLLLLIIILLSGCNDSDTKNSNIRKNAVAGQFYPKDAKDLKEQINSYFKEIEKPETLPFGHLMGLIVPHAGYTYSGKVAAHAYKLLENKKIDTVILLGGSHRTFLETPSVYPKGAYQTPLGNLPINESVVKKIKEWYPSITFVPKAHEWEHSLEVQLPFLQTALKNDFTIVPVLFGKIDSKILGAMAKALYNIIQTEKNILIVVSSDLSHYPDQKNAVKVDNETINLITNFKTLELINRESDIEKMKIPNLVTCQCGLSAVAVLLETAKLFKDTSITLLDYKNSGDMTWIKERVVGYASMAITSKKNHSPEGEEKDSFSLTEDEKKFLLKIARETLESHVKNKKIPDFKIKNDKLKQDAGAFVTLNIDHNLRGCIGYIVPIKPLYQAVIDNAINASSKDHRFPQVTEKELKNIKIEISVLTPPTPVNSYKDIVIGKHGIILKKGFHQSVFLPQVAPEQKWDLETTLSHLSSKAGLSPDEWKSGTSFEVFTAIVFSE
ncbi:MAG: AmmeMemoRadiSam system protein B [Spirochaetes bacterium]|nr:AmmeMemoRadiSam system protein B [Spirochaetota bacterium]